MNKNDFINWLDRPLTETDNKIIDTLLEMIKAYDKNIELIEELTLKISSLQKEILKNNIEEIEVLEIDG